MQQIRYLSQSNFGTYYFRYTLPSWYALRFPFAKKWIYLSLMTKDLNAAKLRVQSLSLFTQKTLYKIKSAKLEGLVDREKSLNSIIEEYRDYIAGADPWEQESVHFRTPDFERIIEHIGEELIYIKEGGLLGYVDQDLNNLEELRKKIENSCKRKNAIEIETILNKMVHSEAKNTVVQNENQSQKTLLSDLLQEYLNDEIGEVRPKTRGKMKSHIDFFIKCIGNIDVNEFSQSNLRAYREKLNQRSRTLKGEKVLISNVTKNDHLTSCRTLFDFAIGHYNSRLENYFTSPAVFYKVKKSDKKDRIPFSSDELIGIFSHEIFTEGEFLHPYQYWAPLLALFTGSRENEISQLRVSDIIVEDGISCISHNLSSPDKHLKTTKEREIPIHPTLIKLGFLDFVNLFRKPRYQWENQLLPHRLFKGLSLDKTNGGYHKNLSRWFNGCYDKKQCRQTGFKYEVGISTPVNQMKDFHNFRHTFSTEMEEVGAQPNISYQITGHSIDSETSKMNKSAGARYRHGVSVAKMYKEICKLSFDDVLINVKPFFELNGEKKCRNKLN
ncbi:site-specific integrase [Paremcibacter congregatus]|uniref:Tyr recombinase domain-containing protein n=1 Tax=Paremcibacter congregatus TaxID=2043170 RepID=A0A2G4YMD5_9PROT|nr:site-specific integrase [Paremcibacter congregatus]PHZ83471.1 hypothetical protein CRD36_18115 [Paremcibacter congregatus]QDE28062.1 site-specific integrase [Paremcibacter congregatus]